MITSILVKSLLVLIIFIFIVFMMTLNRKQENPFNQTLSQSRPQDDDEDRYGI